MPDPLEIAIIAAREAGALQRAGAHQPLQVREVTRHDIKLQMDVDCEERIKGIIRAAFPDDAMLGEEAGGAIAADRPTWIIDPLDGTANYSRGIPHYCVSIALQETERLQVGVVYDPITDELFTARAGGGAYLNGQPIHVSSVDTLADATVATTFPVSMTAIAHVFAGLGTIARGVRKIRVLGAAALDLAYVAAGRFDGMVAYELRTWDIAAGILLIEEAGGRVHRTPTDGTTWNIRADNGRLWEGMAG